MKLVKTFSGGDLLFESPSASPVIEQRALLSEDAFSFPDPYAMPSAAGSAIDYSATHALQQIPQPADTVASYSDPAPLWYNFEFDFNAGFPCEDAWPVANLSFDPYSTPQMTEPALPLSRELSCIDPSTLSAPTLDPADHGFLAPVDFFHSVLQDEQPLASTKRRQSFDEDDDDAGSAPRFRAASYRKMPRLQKTAKSSSSSEEFDLDSDSDRPHACADCGLRFRRDAERARHALVHLPAAQQAVTCGVCGRAVRGGRKDAMRRHQLRTALCVKVQDRYSDEELKSLGCVTKGERAAWKLKTAK